MAENPTTNKPGQKPAPNVNGNFHTLTAFNVHTQLNSKTRIQYDSRTFENLTVYNAASPDILRYQPNHHTHHANIHAQLEHSPYSVHQSLFSATHTSPIIYTQQRITCAPHSASHAHEQTVSKTANHHSHRNTLREYSSLTTRTASEATVQYTYSQYERTDSNTYPTVTHTIHCMSKPSTQRETQPEFQQRIHPIRQAKICRKPLQTSPENKPPICYEGSFHFHTNNCNKFTFTRASRIHVHLYSGLCSISPTASQQRHEYHYITVNSSYQL